MDAKSVPQTRDPKSTPLRAGGPCEWERHSAKQEAPPSSASTKPKTFAWFRRRENSEHSKAAVSSDCSCCTCSPSKGGRHCRLEDLLASLLEHVLSYAPDVPQTVYIGPRDDNRHLQHRYHRSGLASVDLRWALQQPLFLVSRKIRREALRVFFSQSLFVIDLNSIYHSSCSSTILQNLKRHQRLWASETSPLVKRCLQKINRVQVRLPVPSVEGSMLRGRMDEHWMDGSDGQGGGKYKMRSMKQKRSDAVVVHKCLRAVVALLLAPHNERPKLWRSASAAEVS